MTDIDNGSNELKRNLIDVSKYLELDTTFKMKVNIKNPFTEDSFEYDYVEHFCNGVPLPDLEPFLEARRAFEKTGKYCSYVKSLHPHSKYKKFWTEEKRRCVEGLQVGDTYISGYAYFYWNYTIIEIVIELENSTSKTGKKRSERITNFPDVYDSDYFFFKYIDNCENNGVHAALIKKRGWGYSFKIASMIARNYHLIPKSKSFVVADIKEFLLKDGTITKFNDMRGFLANNTAWGKRSQYKDTDIHKRASYKKKIDGAWTESGYKSEVIGISTNGNPDVLRGKRGKLSAYEEVGVNNVFRQSWMVQKSSVEEGDFVYGLLLAGGCVCAGTKVYNKNGESVNIEDLKQSDGILGYDIDKNTVNPQTISWIQPPSKKECIKISTSTRFLECSLDHPILVRSKTSYKTKEIIGKRKDIVKKTGAVYYNNKYKTEYTYSSIWKKAGELKKGDTILIAENIDIWGNEILFDARLIGMLIGDGSYGLRKHYGKIEYKTPSFSNCDYELLDYVESNYKTSCQVNRLTKDGRVYKELIISNLIPLLKDVNIAGQSKTSKRLTSNYQRLTKKESCLLLAGLFDTDGYVQLGKNTTTCKIELTQSTPIMLEEVQFILNKLGIPSIIRKKEPRISPNRKDKNPWYILTIGSKQGIRNFEKNIPLLINSKIDKLKKVINYISKDHRIYNKIDNTVEESIIGIEELGIQNIYNLTALENNTYLANNIITHNTGGTEGADFEGLREVIDNPEVYFTYGVPDIFGGDLTRKRGFFVPGYVSVKGYYDKQGNSDIIGCALHLQQTRQYLRTNDISNQYVRFCAEHPFTVEEAVLKMEGSIFDVISIRERITNLATGKIKPLEYKGKFIRNGEGVVEFYEDLNANPIFKYPLDTTQIDISGCWVIWEHPYKEELLNNGRVVNVARYNRYVMGCDPIDIGEEEQTDTTKEHSLASTFVMDTWTKRIVAEYTGRPAKASDYYHQVILACEYFNGQVLYERNRSGFFTYCSSNNLLHWLADEPKTVREKFGVTGGNLLKGVQTVNRHMGKEYIQEYFRDTVYIDEVTKVSRIHTINSIPFLQECELYSPKKNLDRITAFGILMLFVHDINYQEEELIYKTSSIFEDKFFTEISRRVSKHAKSPI